MKDIFSMFSISDLSSLPDKDFLWQQLKVTIKILIAEDETYRPRDKYGLSGGFLDFSSQTKPVIVVPDLHGRYNFLLDLLRYEIPSGKSVYQSLLDKDIYVVCVGDGMHSERRGKERWFKSFDYFIEGKFDSEPMKEEMIENLSTMLIVMMLKQYFPENFHFLKGNHENILNQNGNGDFPFRKYVLEGEMVESFMSCVYGKGLLNLFSTFEKSLPIVAAFEKCVISHAEPLEAFEKESIINYRCNGGVVKSFTWTANDEAKDGSVKKVLENLLGAKKAESAVYIGGHRIVEGNYALRQNGKYVQIHNADKQNVAFVLGDKIFNPDTDIISVGN